MTANGVKTCFSHSQWLRRGHRPGRTCRGWFAADRVVSGSPGVPPDADAARWLALEVGPALRALDPDARIRLVGEHRPDLDFLDDPPRVTLTGRVTAITGELVEPTWWWFRCDTGVAPASRSSRPLPTAFRWFPPARCGGTRRGGRRSFATRRNRLRARFRLSPSVDRPISDGHRGQRPHPLPERFESNVIETESGAWPEVWPTGRSGSREIIRCWGLPSRRGRFESGREKGRYTCSISTLALATSNRALSLAARRPGRRGARDRTRVAGARRRVHRVDPGER